MALFAVPYFILCLMVGYVGRNRQIGMAGFFILSIFLTPFVMYLAFLLGAPKRELG
jgi:hypothetical protein